MKARFVGQFFLRNPGALPFGAHGTSKTCKVAMSHPTMVMRMTTFGLQTMSITDGPSRP